MFFQCWPSVWLRLSNLSEVIGNRIIWLFFVLGYVGAGAGDPKSTKMAGSEEKVMEELKQEEKTKPLFGGLFSKIKKAILG